MTSLERYDDRAPAVYIDPRDAAVHRLTEWASSATAAGGIAEQLVRTSFVPEAFRGKPYEATAAILAGLEVGLSPMAALRSFDVIQGQAAARAITLRAIVQSQGHDMVLEESTATRCRMRGRRRGTHEWQTVTWTIDRARALGLLGKHNWKAQPQAMLIARATSELARLIASDAILGIGYTVEEIADGASGDIVTATVAMDSSDGGDDSDGAVERPSESGTKRMSRRKPPPVDTTEPVEADVVEDGPTEPQTKKVMALFNEHGIRARDERLAYISAVIGHNVATWKDCTKDEASKVIDVLASDPVDNGPEQPTLTGDDDE